MYIFKWKFFFDITNRAERKRVEQINVYGNRIPFEIKIRAPTFVNGVIFATFWILRISKTDGRKFKQNISN